MNKQREEKEDLDQPEIKYLVIYMPPRRMSAMNNVRGKPHPTFYTKGTNGELITHTSPFELLTTDTLRCLS